VPALMHLAQLAALEGRTAELDSLVARLLTLPVSEPMKLSLRALRCAAGRGIAGDAGLQRELAGAEDWWLALIIWNAAVYGRDPEGAALVAGMLTGPRHPARIRTLGHLLRAHLAWARGRWDVAQAELDAAERLSPREALQHRALLSATPGAPVPREELLAVR
jgi:hypothetical protein